MTFKRWFELNLVILLTLFLLAPDPHTINADPHHWRKAGVFLVYIYSYGLIHFTLFHTGLNLRLGWL